MTAIIKAEVACRYSDWVKGVGFLEPPVREVEVVITSDVPITAIIADRIVTVLYPNDVVNHVTVSAID